MGDQLPQLTLHNTLTRKKEAFAPIDRQNVRLYVCGPTVYDYAHIGNARPAIVFDVLFRLLRHLYGKNCVTYVRNITDVDDKINVRAARDFPDLTLNEAIRQVTQKTANQYRDDMMALGCLEPTHQPRATENIAEMIAIIQTLLDKGNAYMATGQQGVEVLFSVTSMADYGALSNRKLEDQAAGARVAVETHKRHPGDFVLWKESSASEPGWDAEFAADGGRMKVHGRPGWHLECSAMSDRYLWSKIKDRLTVEAQAQPHRFDIHGGGLDLVFPHHENEIAQSRCCFDTPAMANFWMHNGFLQVEGEKMSKSLGNFYSVHELLSTENFGNRKWPGEVLRLAMLMTHYREPIDFSVKRLEEAENIIAKWPGGQAEGGNVHNSIVEPLLDDLNTVAAVQNLHALAQSAQQCEQTARDFAASASFLGVLPVERAMDTQLAAQVEAAITTRLGFIADKNWAEADRIRDELLEKGIRLKDSKHPETGERITEWEAK